jgi:hypothetical protein
LVDFCFWRPASTKLGTKRLIIGKAKGIAKRYPGSFKPILAKIGDMGLVFNHFSVAHIFFLPGLYNTLNHRYHRYIYNGTMSVRVLIVQDYGLCH